MDMLKYEREFLDSTGLDFERGIGLAKAHASRGHAPFDARFILLLSHSETVFYELLPEKRRLIAAFKAVYAGEPWMA